MSGHTPGPWGIRSGSDGRIIVTINEAAIEARGDHFIGSTSKMGSDGAANAARIVACVNFCEGVSDDLLTSGKTLQDFSVELVRLRSMLRERDALAAKVEELAAALRDLMSLHAEEVFIHGDDDGITVAAVLANARAALAR